nr:disease resistance protein At4g27190-like [Ipomoea trifida]
MEAVAAIIGSALIVPFKVVFGSIFAAMKNRFKIHSNYNHLERDITLVLALKSRLRSGLNDEQLQHLLPTTQVQDWSTVTESGITSDAASCSLHCKLSNNIAKQIVKSKQLIEEGKPFENMIVGVPVARPVQYMEVTSIQGQPTASTNLAKMMDLLRSEKYKRIGVWGMGGVGKTTLVKNLNNQLTNDPTFNIVIWVVVSQNATVESVQSKIAERLELQHMMNKEVSKERMASHLYNKLEGQRFLLILDDIWEEINLDDVGIPRPSEHSGSKIILTTRYFNVCQQMLTDIDFQVGRLHPEEAWKLFRETVEEEVVDDNQIKPMAEAIVKECDGLPLALITVGASLRKKREIGLWECAIHALQKSEPSSIRGVEEKVYKPLKWSYDSLQGQQLKSCFLFFCLFPEDFEIDTLKLVQYWVAEGLINEQQNFEQQQNEVVRIVDYLKDSCLLERCQRFNHVKMHDVVRDVGVWIAKSSEEGCKAINKAGISGVQISQQLFNWRINSFSVYVTHDHNNRSLYEPLILNTMKNVFFCGFLFSGDESIGWLLVHAFSCEISGCKGVDLMLDNMVRSSVTIGPFLNLKRLLIRGCCISVKLSSQGCVTECDLLPNLEELFFSDLTELESISAFSNFLGLCFGKLRSIAVYDCDQLENVFTMDGSLHKLVKLESIVIKRCKKLSEVFKNTSTNNFVPMLKSLNLVGLPALEQICKADESWNSLEQLIVANCSMLLKLPLSVQSAENIQSIWGQQNWWNKLQWDNENLKMHLHPLFKPYD